MTLIQGELGLLCRNKMLRPAGIIVFSGTSNVFLMSTSRSSHFWTNLALVPHGPVTISLRTGTGTQPSVCRPLHYRTVL